MVLVAVLTVIYTVLAGMLSVVYTDVVNGVIMLVRNLDRSLGEFDGYFAIFWHTYLTDIFDSSASGSPSPTWSC